MICPGDLVQLNFSNTRDYPIFRTNVVVPRFVLGPWRHGDIGMALSIVHDSGHDWVFVATDRFIDWVRSDYMEQLEPALATSGFAATPSTSFQNDSPIHILLVDS